MRVYIVTNGMGAEIDSAWSDSGKAADRVKALNGPDPQETLAWYVQVTALRNGDPTESHD